MKLKRFFGCFRVTLVSAELPLCLAIIARLVIELIILFTTRGNIYMYSSTLSDAFSPIILFLCGLLICKRHSGLCASVNMSSRMKIFTLLLLSLILSLCFAAADIFIVQDFYRVVSNHKWCTFTYYDLFISQYPVTLFSGRGVLFLLYMSSFYQALFLLGYSISSVFRRGGAARITVVSIVVTFIISVIATYILYYTNSIFAAPAAVWTGTLLLPEFPIFALLYIPTFPLWRESLPIYILVWILSVFLYSIPIKIFRPLFKKDRTTH